MLISCAGFLGAACAPRVAGSSLSPDVRARLAELESRLGGRLGLALVDSDGALLAGNRANERFAMCSTFKAPLAGLILDEAAHGRIDLDRKVPVSRDDLAGHSPEVEKNLERGFMTVEELVAAAVKQSDNAATNLLLAMIGGPEGMTAFFRRNGDGLTRLDRLEPMMNENLVGDPRDTTTPLAMANLLRRLLLTDALAAPARERMTELMIENRTGRNRIRAGAREGWRVGEKTGTGGPAAPTYNDIGILWPPDRPPVLLAIYFDRPDVAAEAANAGIAEATSITLTALP